MTRFTRIFLTTSYIGALVALAGCSHKEYVRETEPAPTAVGRHSASSYGYVRDADDSRIDRPAMSTGLDKEDIRRLVRENLADLRTADVMRQWELDGGRDRVAVFPIENGTGEPIDMQLDTVLAEAETWLVDSRAATLVSREQQPRMIAEVEGEQNAAFDRAHVARYGRQLGAGYYLTGKVRASIEQVGEAERVQYFLFMQVIDVETSTIRWQHTARLTKMRA